MGRVWVSLVEDGPPMGPRMLLSGLPVATYPPLPRARESGSKNLSVPSLSHPVRGELITKSVSRPLAPNWFLFRLLRSSSQEPS